MSILGTAGGIIDGIGSVFEDSDPDKDRERFATIDQWRVEALQDGLGSRAYVHLQCWAGYNSPEAVEFGILQPGQQCRVGSDKALAYAKVVYAEVTARLKAGAALGEAGTVALGAANAVAPGSGTDALTGAIAGELGGIPKVVLLVAIAAGAWLLLRKRR